MGINFSPNLVTFSPKGGWRNRGYFLIFSSYLTENKASPSLAAPAQAHRFHLPPGLARVRACCGRTWGEGDAQAFPFTLTDH